MGKVVRRRCAAWSFVLGEFRDVAWAGFEAVRRLILVVIPGYVHPVWWICLLRDSLYKSFREEVANNQIAALKEPVLISCQEFWVPIHLPSGAVFSSFGSSRCYEIEGFLNAFWQTPTAFCSAAGAIYVYTNFTQFDGTVTIENSSADEKGGAVHLGAPSGEFRDVAWAGFEAVVGSF